VGHRGGHARLVLGRRRRGPHQLGAACGRERGPRRDHRLRGGRHADRGLAGLAAAETGWGVVSDRTFGFYALAAAGAFALSCASWAKDTGPGGHFDILALGLLLAAIGAALAFVAATLVPPSMVFRRVLGWALVLAGFGVGFIGYAPSLNVNF
jgi:hypothetical protein